MHRTSVARTVAVIVAAGTSVVGLVALPQAPSQTSTLPTFRSGVRIVEVDVAVRDKNDQFVDSLTKDDFEVLEDDVPQRIQTLTLVNLPDGDPENRSANNTTPDSSEAFGPNVDAGRLYVMVLDSGHPDRVRTIARQFIQDFLGPSDLMAVVHVRNRDATQGLTQNREQLLAAVDRYEGAPPCMGPESGGLASCSAFRVLKEAAVNLRAVSGRRKAVLFIGMGIPMWTTSSGNPQANAYAADRSSWMKQIWREYDDAVDTATQNNVRISAIHPEGFLVRFADMTGQLAPRGRVASGMGLESDPLSSLRMLAEDTGGTAIVNTGNYGGGYRRIVRENSQYYVLAYDSPSELDGRSHRITVRLRNRPDLVVRAGRKGFVAPAPDVKGRSAKLPRNLSASARKALVAPASGTASPIELFTAVFQATGYEGSVLIGAHVPGTALSLGDKDKLELSYAAVDRWGVVRAVERRAFTLNFGEDARARVTAGGLRLFGRLQLPRGRYEIRVAADQPNGATGFAVTEVEVPDYTDRPLVVSDFVLASSAGTQFTTLEEDAVLRRALPAQPTPNRRFGRGETLTTFAEIYDSHWILSQQIGVTITVESEDGRRVFRGDRVLTTSNRGRFYLTGTLPLRTFVPGTYRLVVEAHTRSGIPSNASQQLEFEVLDNSLDGSESNGALK